MTHVLLILENYENNGKVELDLVTPSQLRWIIIVPADVLAANHARQPAGSLLICFINYTPASTKLKGGILVSPFLSVRLSVCGQNCVRSVSSTILVGSISYLHILSSNLRRCVMCNVCFKMRKCEILMNSLNLLLTWDPKWLKYYG